VVGLVGSDDIIRMGGNFIRRGRALAAGELHGFVRGSDGLRRCGWRRLRPGVSADGKWVIMQAAKGGPLRVVPTGAGEARQLTHDNVSYQRGALAGWRQEVLASD